MSASPAAGRRGPIGAIGSVLARRGAWVVLAIVVVATLAVGSTHPGPQTRADRITYLEGIIKCPVCVDVSIAQSDAQQAVNLRAAVVHMVDAGASEADVERYVVARFGTDELLRPSDPVIWILPVVAGALAAAALAVTLVRRRGSGSRLEPSADDEALVRAALGDRRGAPPAVGGSSSRAVHP